MSGRAGGSGAVGAGADGALGFELRFLGHAAFALTAGATRLVLDPHRPGALGGRMRLPAIVGPFDAIVASHGHEDHAAWTPALGTDRWIERDATLGAISVRFRAVPHDRERGLGMGWSKLVRIDGAGWSLLHAGDLGAWGAADRAFAAGVTVALLPVGGTYTLDAGAAVELAHALEASVIIPMHAACPEVELPLDGLDAFFARWPGPCVEGDVLRWPCSLPAGAALRLRPPGTAALARTAQKDEVTSVAAGLAEKRTDRSGGGA